MLNFIMKWGRGAISLVVEDLRVPLCILGVVVSVLPLFGGKLACVWYGLPMLIAGIIFCVLHKKVTEKWGDEKV